MELGNLQIRRVVRHYVPGSEGGAARIDHGQILESLSPDMESALCRHIMLKMGGSTRCVEMAIVQRGAGSTFSIVSSMPDSDDGQFISLSCQVVLNLVNAQTHPKVPGGVVLVVQAEANGLRNRLVCIIKAEILSGFAHRHILEFYKDLFLTDQSKLYKIAVFYEDDPMSGMWTAFVYDPSLSESNQEGVARYFYQSFLGCGFLESSAKTTQKFYDGVKAYLAESNYGSQRKNTIMNALITYLRADKSPTISIRAFAMLYLDEADHSRFENRLLTAGVPDMDITKDISRIRKEMKRRRIRTRCDIVVHGPSDVFAEKVKVYEVDSDDPLSPGRILRVDIRDTQIE